MGTAQLFKTAFVSAVVVAGFLSTAVAEPAQTGAPARRRPFDTIGQRETALVIDQYGKPVSVVRHRTAGVKAAIFSAQPGRIDPDSVVVFEVHAVGMKGRKLRWRCLATEDVKECFATPVSLRFRDGDRKLILTATARPRVLMTEPAASYAVTSGE
jgi:hypothetical protein